MICLPWVLPRNRVADGDAIIACVVSTLRMSSVRLAGSPAPLAPTPASTPACSDEAFEALADSARVILLRKSSTGWDLAGMESAALDEAVGAGSDASSSSSDESSDSANEASPSRS